MDLAAFQKAFREAFSERHRNAPTYAYWDPLVAGQVDSCPEIPGMLSIKKQQLLNLAYRFLNEDEAYLEVGTYMGKSLVSAMLANPLRPTYACDNFSLFPESSIETVMTNLARYGLQEGVTFYDRDFRAICNGECLPTPVGLYFYDGAHDEQSQYEAIKLAEPFLAEQACVIIDDWRCTPDSGSYAEAGTKRAIAESPHAWRMLYDLPARFNGDRAMWWNGVAVYSFFRA